MNIKLVLFYFLANMIAGMEIQISIDKQELKVVHNEKIVKTYIISSSLYGEGSAEGSFKTPLGEHFIKKKIGDGVELGGRFEGRVFYGEIYPIYKKDEVYVDDDVVQTRILWLSGLEEGRNKEFLKFSRSNLLIIFFSNLMFGILSESIWYTKSEVHLPTVMYLFLNPPKFSLLKKSFILCFLLFFSSIIFNFSISD